MGKETVYIVLSQKHQLKAGSHPGRGDKDVRDWEVAEKIEFVNQLRNRHLTTGAAIADYTNRKIVAGSHRGVTSYEQFDKYVREKYSSQMAELDSAYKADQVEEEVVAVTKMITDQFGNVRPWTVFDRV